jgi:hypothetical protein
MKSEFLARSPLLVLPVTAFLLFMIVFATVLFVTYRKRALAYEPLARLPLEDAAPQDERLAQHGEQP